MGSNEIDWVVNRASNWWVNSDLKEK